MSILEIITGSTLIISCIMIVVIVTAQQPKGSGISGAIMGGDTGGTQSNRRGKSNDAKLSKLTRILAIAFFVITLAVDIIILASNKQ